MMETLERITDEDRQEEIDDFIYDHYEDFRPYVYIFEKVAGLTSEAREFYNEGHFSGISKTYRIEGDELSYELHVSLLKDKDRREDGLSCEVRIR